MVSRCFGEEKGKAGKRESGVNLGGGDRRCSILCTLSLIDTPLNGSCIRGKLLSPCILSYCFYFENIIYNIYFDWIRDQSCMLILCFAAWYPL